MKKALIIHGWDGSPDEPLHKYLKEILIESGYEVQIPSMPNPAVPIIADWLYKIESVFDEDTDIIVGHSVGCQAVLRFLEKTDSSIKIPKIILIAPWMKLDQQTIKEEGEYVVEIVRPWMETSISFENIKEKTGEVIVIFSNNDPYVPLDQVEFFREKLGAKTFVEERQGHFTFHDGFKELHTDIKSII